MANACPRCATHDGLVKTGWCAACEREYDSWVRRYATDIVWAVMAGGAMMMGVGLTLLMLHAGPLVGAAAVVMGGSTMAGLHHWSQRRRRKQFLRGLLPRAYLPAPK